ncbi:MAG: pyridoxine 5'-phosphate synthase [Candidatus Binataceae bacterium]
MPKLGVNVDHVATLRQARRVDYPDPVEAARAAERAGADAITVHLREDRRHIQDYDLFSLRSAIKIHLNQELAPVDEMVELALRLRPHEVCFVPERREEITTEGGLDAAGLHDRLDRMARRFRDLKIGVSVFIAPDPRQIKAAASLGADFVEIHTGTYANLADADLRTPAAKGDVPRLGESAMAELGKIRSAVDIARKLKLKPNAGHGLNYRNIGPVAAIPGIQWFHIGHAIVARSTMVGMSKAVSEMIDLLRNPLKHNLAKRPAKRR